MSIFFCYLLFVGVILSVKCSCSSGVSGCDSCYFEEYVKNSYKEFHQRNKVFWEFNDETKSWVQLKLPYDLVSCQDGGCQVVGSIQETRIEDGRMKMMIKKKKKGKKRWFSLTKISEMSIWVTGQSGSIYERYWNGMQWVIAPHSLHSSPGFAISVFYFNHTVLAITQQGLLYQLQLTEDSLPIWVELKPEIEKGRSRETPEISEIHFSSGVISQDKGSLHLLTQDGLLVQLLGINPPRLANRGRPPGANIVAVTDGSTFKPGLLFAVSEAGELYEHDQMTKPSWKKHILTEEAGIRVFLSASKPCTANGLLEERTGSIFLLSKEGELVERRLQQRKWKWILHGKPIGHELTSMTCTYQEGLNQNPISLFFTTETGSAYEYHIPMHTANSKHRYYDENWLNHDHPAQSKVSQGTPGLQLVAGRVLFPLEDGRIGELHFPGFGGQNVGLSSSTGSRRKSQLKYVWTVLDAPETEGWNAEYCTEERGPSNCIQGTKDENSEVSSSRWRKDSKTEQNYLIPSLISDADSIHGESYTTESQILELFRLRLIHEQASFFIISANGLILEYLHSENLRLWLKHDPSKIVGILGYYNGSLFLVDEEGSLLMGKGGSSEMEWINCTALKKGRRVIGGRPWDSIPGQAPRVKPGDSVFFISRSGRLLQFSVTMKGFKWKDSKNPPGTRIASIVDQEIFRENIVFAVGLNGRLYQYNKVTELWHEHHQSQHLVLSRSLGTATRPAAELSLRGSLFMLSEEGKLVEYKWNTAEGWNWIEHGSPGINVKLVGAPGPCFRGTELFLVGSDGNAHLRLMDQGEWRWINCGFPDDEYESVVEMKDEFHGGLQGDEESSHEHCHPKVASTRPIPFSGDAVIFELQDGRLAEMKQVDGKTWQWSRIMATPTSLCQEGLQTSSTL